MRQVSPTTRRLLLVMYVASFLINLGFRAWQAMFNNFAVEQVGVGPLDLGWIQSVREVPGLLGFVMGFIALLMPETRIVSLSVILMGLGIVMTGQATTVPFLLVSTFVMSTGFHFVHPARDASVLMAVSRAGAPGALGRLGSLSAVAAVIGSAVVLVLAPTLGYRSLFTAVGVLVVAGGLVAVVLSRQRTGPRPRRKVVLRRRYWVYYLLALLMGSRYHVSSVFAVFLLVRQYGVSVQAISLLLMANSLLSIVMQRVAGRVVARFGERRVMSGMFLTLIPVYLGYAFVPLLPVLFALFVLDNALGDFTLAINTYFQKIAVSPDEITGNVSVQQTINHSVAVLVPVLGGLAWESYGFRAPFLVGVALAIATLTVAQFMRTGAVAPGEPGSSRPATVQ